MDRQMALRDPPSTMQYDQSIGLKSFKTSAIDQSDTTLESNY